MMLIIQFFYCSLTLLKILIPITTSFKFSWIPISIFSCSFYKLKTSLLSTILKIFSTCFLITTFLMKSILPCTSLSLPTSTSIPIIFSKTKSYINIIYVSTFLNTTWTLSIQYTIFLLSLWISTLSTPIWMLIRLKLSS